jgi:hypothetical protein
MKETLQEYYIYFGNFKKQKQKKINMNSIQCMLY